MHKERKPNDGNQHSAFWSMSVSEVNRLNSIGTFSDHFQNSSLWHLFWVDGNLPTASSCSWWLQVWLYFYVFVSDLFFVLFILFFLPFSYPSPFFSFVHVYIISLFYVVCDNWFFFHTFQCLINPNEFKKRPRWN